MRRTGKFVVVRLLLCSTAMVIASVRTRANIIRRTTVFDHDYSRHSAWLFGNSPFHCRSGAILRTGIVPPDCLVSRVCCVPAACRYVRKYLYELCLSQVAISTHFMPSRRIDTTVAEESDRVRGEAATSVILTEDNRARRMYRSQKALRRTSCRLRQHRLPTCPVFEFPS